MALGRNVGGRPRKKKGAGGAGFVYHRVTFFDNGDITTRKIGEALNPKAGPDDLVTGVAVWTDAEEEYVLTELRAGRLPKIDTRTNYSGQQRGYCAPGCARIYKWDAKKKETRIDAS
jgi:hypothetical protein